MQVMNDHRYRLVSLTFLWCHIIDGSMVDNGEGFGYLFVSPAPVILGDASELSWQCYPVASVSLRSECLAVVLEQDRPGSTDSLAKLRAPPLCIWYPESLR